ncbi:hypothetical protein OAH07_03080, partial [Verrucomicrobia bacterium]|nr:hypothetical protein [Verrucomicrobiota bacterium]
MKSIHNLKSEDNKTFNKKTICVVGLDHISNKAIYYALELRKKNVETTFISLDKTGQSDAIARSHNLNIVTLKKEFFYNVYKIIRTIYKINYDHVEIFLAQKPWYLLIYYGLIKIKNKPYIV